MKIGVIADDFTGASDIALTLAESGMSVKQFVNTPLNSQVGDVDAGVVSLKIRTMPVSTAINQALKACEWLLNQGCEQIIYKICSTFDSTDKGNIGQVLEALALRLKEDIIVVCPAFPENGRSVYQGHLFVGDLLLNESGMKNHPLTPMTDSNLVKVLSRQTNWSVGLIAKKTISQGFEYIQQEMTGEKIMFIADAINEQDLKNIGLAVKGRKLICGGSGISLGLAANFGMASKQSKWNGVYGKSVILSGSCSSMTRTQIEQYKQIAPAFELMAEDVMSETVTIQDLVGWANTHDATTLIYSSADPEIVKEAQDKFGKGIVADKIENLFKGLAAAFATAGYMKIISAGGETSGAVIQGLNMKSLTVGPRIAAGVPALLDDDNGLAVALKSGNFGDEHFFQSAINKLSGTS